VPHLSYNRRFENRQTLKHRRGNHHLQLRWRAQTSDDYCNRVFVGSDSVLVAPVKIGDGAYIAAGSAITENVPPNALGIARSRQSTKPGWAAKKRRETAGSAPSKEICEEKSSRQEIAFPPQTLILDCLRLNHEARL